MLSPTCRTSSSWRIAAIDQVSKLVTIMTESEPHKTVRTVSPSLEEAVHCAA